jgi:predicted dehydrogenase
VPATEDFRSQWAEVPDNDEFDNAFKVQWEKFLRHVADGEEFPWSLWEGAKGVQLAELGLRSAAEGRRLEVSPIVAPKPAAPSEVAG